MLAGFGHAAHPAARLTLVDGAGAMLERARERLGDAAAELVVADLADPLPTGPWDGVVSALAIHHLDDPGKRALFAASTTPCGPAVCSSTPNRSTARRRASPRPTAPGTSRRAGG